MNPPAWACLGEHAPLGTSPGQPPPAAQRQPVPLMCSKKLSGFEHRGSHEAQAALLLMAPLPGLIALSTAATHGAAAMGAQGESSHPPETRAAPGCCRAPTRWRPRRRRRPAQRWGSARHAVAALPAWVPAAHAPPRPPRWTRPGPALAAQVPARCTCQLHTTR